MSLDERPAAPSQADYGQPPPTSVAIMPPTSLTVASSSASTTQIDPNRATAFERWAARASDSQFNALAGAVGGFTSGIVTCPLDVIKTKLQAQGGLAHLNNGRHVGQRKLYNGLLGTANVIWRDEGLRGMYRGLGPIILGYLPTWAVWFTVYNKSKKELSQYHNNNIVINFWSSIIAGASSTIVTNPIWVIKTRLMSQNGRHDRTRFSYFPKGANTPTSRPTISMHGYYHSTFDAARKMYTTEGIRAFYSGLSPALLGLTHVAVQFPAYEFLKTKFTGQGMGEAPASSNAKSEWAGILSASILSKIMASSATYPHEVIRTRLQTQRRPMPGAAIAVEEVGGLAGLVKTGGSGPDAKPSSAATSAQQNAQQNVQQKQPQQQQQQTAMKYKGIVRTFRTILHEEGWMAFYAGMGTNMMRAVPAATVTMLTYEFMMRELNGRRALGRSKLEAQEHSSFA